MSNPYKGGKYAAKNKQKIQEPEQNNMEPQKNGSIKSSGTVACFDWTESVVISSWSYKPQQFDVVVLKRTVGLDEPIVKRVIATEGQRVYIDYDEGAVYVDGEKLDESAYLSENVKTTKPLSSEKLIEFPEEGLVVPEGHIFVLGDNRSVSLDSRFEAVGMVDERYVLGKALFKIYPFNHIGTIKS